MKRLPLFVKASVGLLLVMFLLPLPAQAALSGPQKIIVLRVYFQDFSNSTRFTAAQVEQFFKDLNALWGADTSYGNISVEAQISDLYQVPNNSATYLDAGGGNSSSTAGFSQLVSDAVSQAPGGLNWSGIHSLMILFADTRPGGFYRGLTYFSWSINPPTGGVSIPVSVVGENPNESPVNSWGRWGHELGHELQSGQGPAHPSNYNSSFEIMDDNYPGQSGMFEKEANEGFPGWMPPGKYHLVKPPEGGEATIFAEEHNPADEPDYQAIKASLSFGGPQLYYLISVRRRIHGDNLNPADSPPGLPDEGVLIERVVEGGDPNINDCAPQTCNRWVNVIGNGGNASQLWHAGDSYNSAAENITIAVREKLDDDHYLVDVSYGAAGSGKRPDVGINSWLQPPGNTWETTDIWIDSPVNGYGNYRYGLWSDLMGGIVPQGNGDDPAVGQVNRIYVRVRNYGSAPASNVTVYIDITNPPGLGISNGFINLGSITPAQFPSLALINPGQHVDVYLPWTPNFQLTPQQIEQGRFYFHTCLRVRLSHVTGETFFANQDGNGQQENIAYFDATGPKPGAPGAPNSNSIHLRNNSSSQTVQYYLSYLRDTVPSAWKVKLNGGNPVVTLAPNGQRDVPITIQQTTSAPIGSTYGLRVFAANQVTLTNPHFPKHPHNEVHVLGGVQINTTVLQRTSLTCAGGKGGIVQGKIGGFDPGNENLKDIRVLVEAVNPDGSFAPSLSSIAFVNADGSFTARLVGTFAPVKRGICLFAGTTRMSSSGSPAFNFP